MAAFMPSGYSIVASSRKRRAACSEEGHVQGLLGRADDGGRTRDLRLGKPALYRLSYVRAAADSSARYVRHVASARIVGGMRRVAWVSR
jgi:hypothetical protein